MGSQNNLEQFRQEMRILDEFGLNRREARFQAISTWL